MSSTIYYTCRVCGHVLTIEPGQLVTADIKIHCGQPMNRESSKRTRTSEKNTSAQPGDVVQVTVYARVKETSIDGSGYWLDIHGVTVAVPATQIQRVIPSASLSENARRILTILYELKGGYITSWHLGKALGGDATSIQAADVLHGSEWTQRAYEQALRELVDIGIVEEIPNLGERWHLVIDASHR